MEQSGSYAMAAIALLECTPRNIGLYSHFIFIFFDRAILYVSRSFYLVFHIVDKCAYYLPLLKRKSRIEFLRTAYLFKYFN